MAHFPRTHQQLRAPRVRVPNDEFAVVKSGATQTKLALLVLSATGGCLRTKRPFEEGTLAEILLQTTTGPVTALIEWLYPRQPGTQPFRFIAIPDGEFQRLDVTISRMRRLGLGAGAL